MRDYSYPTRVNRTDHIPFEAKVAKHNRHQKRGGPAVSLITSLQIMANATAASKISPVTLGDTDSSHGKA